MQTQRSQHAAASARPRPRPVRGPPPSPCAAVSWSTQLPKSRVREGTGQLTSFFGMSTPPAEDSVVAEVFWRPGCRYCSALWRDLSRQGAPTSWHNIWADEQASQFVRSVNRGSETVPTVRVGSQTLTNPRRRGFWRAAGQVFSASRLVGSVVATVGGADHRQRTGYPAGSGRRGLHLRRIRGRGLVSHTPAAPVRPTADTSARGTRPAPRPRLRMRS